MQTGSAAIMDVERLWPTLAGKQTCANDAAGKVIHYWVGREKVSWLSIVPGGEIMQSLLWSVF